MANGGEDEYGVEATILQQTLGKERKLIFPGVSAWKPHGQGGSQAVCPGVCERMFQVCVLKLSSGQPRFYILVLERE